MDDIDIITERQQALTDITIRRIRDQVAGNGATIFFCGSCGDEIERRRREKNPGCKFCVDCQNKAEAA